MTAPDGDQGGLAGAGAGGGHVVTVPPGRNFLAALAEAVLAGELPRPGGAPPSPLDLPAMTILLPTPRAARALQQAFLAASGRRALALPRIRPIAEGEEDLALLSDLAAAEPMAAQFADVPPAVSELERRLVLTELVLRWSAATRRTAPTAATPFDPFAGSGAATPAQAAQLATELSRLIDMVETENVSLAGLSALVPENYSEHWQKTLGFLEIVLDWWPQHLAERGLISPVERRNRLILAEAGRLASLASRHPVIVAGVTGSIPATAELMRVVARLDHGAIVLPGLDHRLDEDSWQTIVERHPEHPQNGLAKLLAALGVARAEVTVLPGRAASDPGRLRADVLSEALRPAATTERWHAFIAGADQGEVRSALDGVSLIEAPSGQDEAEAVALILREALEVPGRTAALVSPDRRLARRVAVRLESWGIEVDDSAGRPFGKTPPGALLDLLIEAAGRAFEPVALMALLKHPLTRLGLPVGKIRRAARVIELAAFRTPYIGRGLDGVEAAIERAAREVAAGTRRQRAMRALHGDDWSAARDLIRRLAAAVAPLSDLFRRHATHPLKDITHAHVAAAEALTALPEEDSAGGSGAPLWRDEAGEAGAVFFAQLFDPALRTPEIAPADYPDLYRGLVARETVRPRVAVHPRLAIWGPFEARLQQPDIMVLGSLNEGTWPEAADPGPWLNRPMRQALGLPQPEEQIGRAAHDFTQLCGARRVYLTRAQKIDGVPTVPSRWLLRLLALLDGLAARAALNSDRPWLQWARARDHIAARRTIKPPEPRPALALRPRSLSVSDVETWIANPYAIFAARILGLEALDVLGAPPGPALRGAIVHEALGRFATRFPDRLPGDPRGELLKIARNILAEYTGNPRIAAFWLPRFVRFADWFAETEGGRRDGVSRVLAEVSGATVLEGAAGGPFTLRARADRIDIADDGLVIVDYKTASASAIDSLATRALKQEAPQLPLEAMIAASTGFADAPAQPVTRLRYISTAGGEPPGYVKDLATKDVAALAAAARIGLERLIDEFDRETTPYRALRRARFRYDYDSYAHLARVAEWSTPENGEEE